ncbi:MAG: hypothetical protein LC437_06840 [Thiohalomonas sp.]|nr:hypothetical protein [Thiohalomonas sp.]
MSDKEMPDKDASDKIASSEQFNAVLMSFIHDIKNSFLISLSSLETFKPELKDNVYRIQYELQCINNSLVQLLSLYKMETHLFSIQADQYNLYDFLEEIIINNSLINEKNDFSIKMECDETIEWFFNKDLIAAIINNSTRYAKPKIKLSAKIINDYLQICIEDDGKGFPEKMFVHPDSLETAIDIQSGTTGLDLYFAEKIPNIHHNGDKRGFTVIDNKSQLGGGQFKLL